MREGMSHDLAEALLADLAAAVDDLTANPPQVAAEQHFNHT